MLKDCSHGGFATVIFFSQQMSYFECQCKCSHGVLAITAILNSIQPINCDKQIAITIESCEQSLSLSTTMQMDVKLRSKISGGRISRFEDCWLCHFVLNVDIFFCFFHFNFQTYFHLLGLSIFYCSFKASFTSFVNVMIFD